MRGWGRGRDGGFHRRWEQDIIRIEEQDPIPAAQREARIQRRVLAAVFLQYRNDSIAVTRNDFARAVCGTVVYYNDLCIAVGLVESAVNGFAQQTRVVIVTEDDAVQVVAHSRLA